MARQISVKITTTKLIDALRGSIKKLELKRCDAEASKSRYDKACEIYQAQLKKCVTKGVYLNTTAAYAYNSDTSGVTTLDMSYRVPNELLPTKPQPEAKVFTQEDRDAIANIENTIALLELSDEPTINTATYSAVLRYL